jgi:hypothetical protein
MQEVQRVAGQVGPPDDLVQRSAQNQGEIVRIPGPRLGARRGEQAGDQTGLRPPGIGHGRVTARA